MIPDPWGDVPDLAPLLEALFDSVETFGGLSSAEQALIGVGLCAATGRESLMVALTRRALDAGVSPAAVVDALLVVALSRGARALWTARDALEYLDRKNIALPPPPASLDVKSYLAREFGAPPAWLDWLQGFAPPLLYAYLTLRQVALSDGPLPRKFKELLTMVLNATDNNVPGMRAHGLAALRYGATAREILGTLAAAIPVCGIIVWINGIGALAPLLGSTEGSLPIGGD